MRQFVDRVWRAGYIVAYRVLRVWWWLAQPAVRGAYVAVWRGGELLVIKNSYRSCLTIPCGSIGRGETPREAARRELEEEVGIQVESDELRPAGDFVVHFESKRDHAYVFELDLPSDPPPRVCVDRREVVWAEFWPAERIQSESFSPHVMEYLRLRCETA